MIATVAAGIGVLIFVFGCGLIMSACQCEGAEGMVGSLAALVVLGVGVALIICPMLSWDTSNVTMAMRILYWPFVR